MVKIKLVSLFFLLSVAGQAYGMEDGGNKSASGAKCRRLAEILHSRAHSLLQLEREPTTDLDAQKALQGLNSLVIFKALEGYVERCINVQPDQDNDPKRLNKSSMFVPKNGRNL